MKKLILITLFVSTLCGIANANVITLTECKYTHKQYKGEVTVDYKIDTKNNLVNLRWYGKRGS